MASAVARAYNKGLRAKPPAGSRGRAHGQGDRGPSFPEAEALLVFECSMEDANLTTCLKFGNAKKSDRPYLCYFCKISWVATKLGGWSKTVGCAPRPGPKTATARNPLFPLQCQPGG